MMAQRWLMAMRAAVWGHRQREQDLDDEFQAHLEMEAARHVALGLPPDEAVRRARIDFGGVERFKEECRDQLRSRPFEDLVRDLRFGVRTLRRAPSFTIAALLTLSLGIGGSAAIFGAVRSMLLKPMPYRDTRSLVFVWQRDVRKGDERLESSPANFLDWRARSQSFERLTAAEPHGLTWRREEGAVYLPTWLVYEGFFDLLGTAPLIGRTFRDEEYRAGNHHVVVLGHRIWRERFGADPGVVGRRIDLEGRSWTVIGVMPESFAIPSNESMWAPKIQEGWEQWSRSGDWYTVIGRIRGDRGLIQASEEMNGVAAQLAREYPATNAGTGVTLVSFDDQILGRVRGPLWIMLGAVVALFLIACANLANLQIARAISRTHEFAMRSALGATPGRLARQLLTEVALLAGTGCVLGFIVAGGMLEGIRVLAPPDLPRRSDLQIDGWVLAFSMVGAVIAAALTGVVPVRVARRASVRAALAATAPTATAGRRARRMRDLLVVTQIALALMLLVGAGLLLRSFVNLVREDRGFRTDGIGVVVVHTWDHVESDAASVAFVTQACERVLALPGVRSVGVASSVPMLDPIGAEKGAVTVPGRDMAPGTARTADVNIVTRDYFATLGVPIRRGRGLTAIAHVKGVLRDLLPTMPVTHEGTLDSLVGASVRDRRFLLTLIALFAALAVGLSLIGTFGVMSYSTLERTREIGVRIAFGARNQDVMLMVLGRGVRLALFGIVLGWAGAAALTRQLGALMYGIQPSDAPTYVGCAALLLMAAIVACWVPAAKAARTDPMVALRAE